jgi:hypothetical protein
MAQASRCGAAHMLILITSMTSWPSSLLQRRQRRRSHGRLEPTSSGCRAAGTPLQHLSIRSSSPPPRASASSLPDRLFSASPCSLASPCVPCSSERAQEALQPLPRAPSVSLSLGGRSPLWAIWGDFGAILGEIPSKSARCPRSTGKGWGRSP